MSLYLKLKIAVGIRESVKIKFCFIDVNLQVYNIEVNKVKRAVSAYWGVEV
jgi:hypothetical protein